jgi:hypothetical protein
MNRFILTNFKLPEERSWAIEQMPASDGLWPSVWVSSLELRGIRKAVKYVSARWLRASMSSRKMLPVCKGKKPCADG